MSTASVTAPTEFDSIFTDLIRGHYGIEGPELVAMYAIVKQIADAHLKPLVGRMSMHQRSSDYLVLEAALRLVLGMTIDLRMRRPGDDSPHRTVAAEVTGAWLEDARSLPTLQFKTSATEAMAIVATIQFALRHPLYTGELAQCMRRMAAQLAEILIVSAPSARAVINLGWEGAIR